ncbi:MAG: penicillin-binding protein 1B [Gammaproteobacteria bacterium]
MARKRRPHKSSLFLRYWRPILLLLIVSLAGSAVYVAWLDRDIRQTFVGKRWALPAQVYARPLDLYTGQSISMTAVQNELEASGFREVRELHQSGEYVKSADMIQIYTRRFRFWDMDEPARQIRLRFNATQLSQMFDLQTGDVVPLLRLAPQVIGKIYPEHHEDRVLVKYADVPEALIDALIAVEDNDFFQHHGIDPVAILRAAWVNLRAGRIRQGGSTLTQQLVKNFYLTQDRNWWRKINEAIMAILLELHYDKETILEAYLNEVYLGQQGRNAVHGFGLAAEFYFRRPLTELKPDQLALLVGLARGASYYNPRRYPDRALQRRNLVLGLMAEQGYLDKDAVTGWQQQPLGISAMPGWTSDRYPAFLELVREQLQRDYNNEDLRSEGLRIFTTLDPVQQQLVQRRVDERLLQLEKTLPETDNLQAAVIIANPNNGEVAAVLGGRSTAAPGFNRALRAQRQIGSLIKPFVYLTALAQPQDYNVLSRLIDMPIKLPQSDGSYWEPENYDRQFHGEVLMHEALAKSYNVATVNLGLDLGVDTVASVIEQLLPGVRVPHYPSLFLGAIDLTPLQVTQMYQILAAGGFRTPLKAIHAVLDRNGEPLSRYSLSVDQVTAVAPAYLTNYLLTGVIANGTARSAAVPLAKYLPLAGKTGTTDDLRDSWFAGFGADVLGVVWIGRDDNASTGLTGSSGALRLWTDIMQDVQPRPVNLEPPADVRWEKILEGRRTDTDCPHAHAYPFIVPYLPADYVNCEPLQQPAQSKSPWERAFR